MAGILANGTKLGYKTGDESTYINLEGLQAIPEMGAEAETVEITCLADKNKRYVKGIGDFGDLEFTFLYDNSSDTAPYRVLRNFELADDVVSFELAYPDGTKFNFEAQVSVKLSSGEVNGVLTFTAKLTLNSNITAVDPS